MKVTVKKLNSAYLRIERCRRSTMAAIRFAEKVELIKCPENFADGYHKRINELHEIIDSLSAMPIAKANQRELSDIAWGFKKKKRKK